MKKLIALSLIALGILPAYAQNNKTVISDSPLYQKLKANGELIEKGYIVITPENTVSQTVTYKKGQTPHDKSSLCFGYTPPNSGATPTLANVDDQATGPISLPFNFCFYGTTYTSCYLNSNGNITFGLPYTTFTASGFPSATVPPMIAPFWGDFDMRGSGVCYYEILSNAAIFHWVNGGYYGLHTDKLNTMQLIITDGTSNLLSPGNNVGFFYDNMDWTTGDASSGVNGFGGTPATVGVNQGNGIDYIQLGRFDQPGTAYDGPFGNNDGVDWLDYQTFMFNVCSSSNIPPMMTGIAICDTLRLCVGDTLPLNLSFLAPEATQTTQDSVNAYTLTNNGFTIISNTQNGNTANLVAQLVGTTSNMGAHVIDFVAWDNGTPADTVVFSINVVIDSANFTPQIIASNTAYCPGNSVTLSADTVYDAYNWIPGGASTSSTNVTQGQYVLQATRNGCTVSSAPITIYEYPAPTPVIAGDTLFCSGDSAMLYVLPDTSYASFLWNTNQTNDTIYTQNSGSYSVQVTNHFGCTGSSNTINVINFAATTAIQGNLTYCYYDSALLSVNTPNDSLIWYNGSTNNSIYSTDSLVYVTVYLNSCQASDTVTLTTINVPKPVIPDTSFCAGSNVVLNAGAGYSSYSWNTGATSQTLNVTQAGQYIVTVTISGCINSDTSQVTEIPSPTPQIVTSTGDTVFHYCFTDSLVLTTVNNYSQYVWSPSNQTTASITAGTGTYTVTVTDNNGCQGSTSVSVTSSAPAVTITGDTGVCEGTQVILTATGGYPVYNWNTGDTTNTVYITNAGQYIVAVTDNFGCSASDTMNFTPYAIPNANFSVNPPRGFKGETSQFTDESTISSGNITTWTWTFGDGMTDSIQNPTHIYGDKGTYTVSLLVISNHGCRDSISVEYLVVAEILTPNVISPNGDGENDYLVFPNLLIYPSNHLTVFNRWGHKVYETDNYQNNWDASNVQAGTYYYILEVDGLEPIKNSLTIIK